MIEWTTGNLFESEAEALVNAVNTVGVMGKGIALTFKETFPENFRAYKAACAAKQVQLGRMFVTRRADAPGPKWIINFPTKDHWRNPSKMEWIVSGLHDLKRVIAENNIRSVALPALGAGNGGLDWSEVHSRIETEWETLTNVHIAVFEPTEKYQDVAKRRRR